MFSMQVTNISEWIEFSGNSVRSKTNSYNLYIYEFSTRRIIYVLNSDEWCEPFETAKSIEVNGAYITVVNSRNLSTVYVVNASIKCC